MSASWRGLHAALLTFVTTSRALVQFEAARAAELELARFLDPSELITHLETENKEPAVLDGKDRLYAALIRGVQARATWTELAHAIIWCGLWPGLNRGYCQRAPRTNRDVRDELAATMTMQLIRLTGRLDLASVTRVAATLAQSTLRETTREQSRERREAWLWSGRPFPEHRPGQRQEARDRIAERARLTMERAREAVTTRSLPDDVGAQTGMTFEAAYAALRRRLMSELREDTDLILGVLVLGESRQEVAERHGISPSAMRKRLERALPSVRSFLLHFSPLQIVKDNE